MYVGLSLFSNITIYPTLNDICVVLCKSLAESSGRFWQPVEFENVANPDFKNLKYLQNPEHFSLTKGCIYRSEVHIR